MCVSISPNHGVFSFNRRPAFLSDHIKKAVGRAARCGGREAGWTVIATLYRCRPIRAATSASRFDPGNRSAPGRPVWPRPGPWPGVWSTRPGRTRSPGVMGLASKKGIGGAVSLAGRARTSPFPTSSTAPGKTCDPAGLYASDRRRDRLFIAAAPLNGPLEFSKGSRFRNAVSRRHRPSHRQGQVDGASCPASKSGQDGNVQTTFSRSATISLILPGLDPQLGKGPQRQTGQIPVKTAGHAASGSACGRCGKVPLPGSSMQQDTAIFQVRLKGGAGEMTEDGQVAAEKTALRSTARTLSVWPCLGGQGSSESSVPALTAPPANNRGSEGVAVAQRGHRGAVENRHAAALHEKSDQGGDVAEPDEHLGVSGQGASASSSGRIRMEPYPPRAQMMPSISRDR